MRKKLTILLSVMFLVLIALGVLPACDDAEEDFQVIFFDIENNISDDGESFEHLYGTDDGSSVAYNGASPAECYMIKCGDVEILVDGGFRTYSSTSTAYKERIANIYKNNVIPKILEYCTDGVIDYLIVTHGDFDHIAGLAVDGGLLDYCADESNGLSINYIIDFDSEMAAYLSEGHQDGLNSANNTLFSISEDSLISYYRTKRDELVENGTKHVPAASLFKDTDMFSDCLGTEAMPDNIATNSSDKARVTNIYYFNNGTYTHQIGTSTSQYVVESGTYDRAYDDDVLTDANGNQIGGIESKNERYYYAISLKDGVELRILYNWYYDHFYKHSFNSQDRNNISVCFQVVSEKGKFMSFGDLGTGESGLINYYEDTDILKNVTCFKASHHGSTTNGENSEELYELMEAKTVIITGVAQINRDILKGNGMTNDPIYSGLSSTAVIKEQFFTNVKAGSSDTKIYCTQIVKLDDSTSTTSFMAAPFCGDIIVTIGHTVFNKLSYNVDCTYKGEITCYVSSYSESLKNYTFSNFKNGSLLSFDETDYYTVLYKNKGISA